MPQPSRCHCPVLTCVQPLDAAEQLSSHALDEHVPLKPAGSSKNIWVSICGGSSLRQLLQLFATAILR